MSEPTTTPNPTTPVPAAPVSEPATPKPQPPPPKSQQSPGLDELLAGLDDTARSAILGEVSKARGEAADIRRKLREAEPRLSEYDRLVAASKSDLERAQETATAQENRAKALLTRAVKAEVKALAAAGFADPDDAAAFLDLTKYATADGDVDTETVKTDLAALLARKPHLGKAAGARMPAPNPAQGSSGNGTSKPGQLSQADVKRMYAAKDYEGITKAKAEGRLSDLMSGT